MKTSFQEVYDCFLNKIKDYDFLTLAEDDIESLCYKYMVSSIPLIKYPKKIFENMNNTFQQFDEKLSYTEIEILANLMLVQWTTPQIYSITNMKQFLGDSEYKFYSQANHLDKLYFLKDKALDYADGLMINNSYSLDALDDLNSVD